MKRRKPSKQERQSRMTLTLTLSGCVFVVTLVTLLIIGAALLIVDRTGQLGKWMEHSSILSFFLIIAAISLVGGTLMALLLGTFPLRSVSEMTQGLHRLASGDYDVRIEPKGLMATIAPLRDMVESFNATASELAGTEMLRSDFINNFSHEFKTPIVSIAGFASLLRQGDLTRAEQLEYLDIIESESKRLTDMATNVLNMTKVENQAILTDVSTFNLSEQLRTCVLLLERKWEKKNLEMNLDLEEYTVSGNQELLRQVEGLYFPKFTVRFTEEELKEKTAADVTEAFTAAAAAYYEQKEQAFTSPVMREVERVVLLRVVDEYWMDHIDAMADLRQGIRLRAYAQTDPIIAYKKESLDMFEEMISAIQSETVRRLYSVRIKKDEEIKRERVAKATGESVGGDGTVKKQPRRVQKIGRNDPCPCGSGKKYKNCCGRNA